MVSVSTLKSSDLRYSSLVEEYRKAHANGLEDGRECCHQIGLNEALWILKKCFSDGLDDEAFKIIR